MGPHNDTQLDDLASILESDKQKSKFAIEDLHNRVLKVESKSGRRPINFPKLNIGKNIRGAAKTAAYAGPRFALFALITVASIAGATIGYDSVVEGTPYTGNAWVGLASVVALIFPTLCGIWATRDRNNGTTQSSGRQPYDL